MTICSAYQYQTSQDYKLDFTSSFQCQEYLSCDASIDWQICWCLMIPNIRAVERRLPGKTLPGPI